MLSEQVRKTTGRDFAVRGPLSIRLLPRIGVAADDVVLGNAPWGTRKDMLVVQHARFDIALWPLLQGLVDIASVSFDGVDLLLETDRNGVGNWAMGRERRQQRAGSSRRRQRTAAPASVAASTLADMPSSPTATGAAAAPTAWPCCRSSSSTSPATVRRSTPASTAAASAGS